MPPSSVSLRNQLVLERLATSDKTTIVIEKQLDGNASDVRLLGRREGIFEGPGARSAARCSRRPATCGSQNQALRRLGPALRARMVRALWATRRSMTETALQGVTALHLDVTALRQMAAARVRRNSGCNGVAGECNSVAGECNSVAHFDRPARAPAARARGQGFGCCGFW
jgi:hypothetical protein